MTPLMTQQDVAAVKRSALIQAVIRATEDGDHHPHISQWAAERAVQTVLDALRSGDERERVARLALEAIAHGTYPPSCGQASCRHAADIDDHCMDCVEVFAATKLTDAILGGQSCPPPPNPEGKPS